jgi:hypothetical protein
VNPLSVVFLITILGVASEQPPLPYIDEGACPFECCTYREWTANEDVIAFAEPKDGASFAFTIKAGSKVTAETGFVVTSKAGVTRILKPIKLGYEHNSDVPPPEPELDLKSGELLYTLHYLGEGYDLFWYQGKLYSDQISASKPDADPPPPDATLQVVSLPVSDWWVKIQAQDGRVGWIRNPPYFDGADACA